MSIVGVIGVVLATGKPHVSIETLAPLINGSTVPTSTPDAMDKLAGILGLLDFSSVNILDVADLVFTIILGIAAAVIATKSNAINRRAIRQSKSTLEHEKEMRKLENRISVIDKAFDIYRYFTYKASNLDYYLNLSIDDILSKMDEAEQIAYISKFIFNDNVYAKIKKEYNRVITTLIKLTDFSDLFDDKVNHFILAPERREQLNNEYNEYLEVISDMISEIKYNIIEALDEYKLNL